MSFRFDNDTHPQRLAKSLHRLLSDGGHAGPLARSRDLLARMLGHPGWDAFLADCRSRPVPSPHDHAVDGHERHGRRLRGLAALTEAGIPRDRAVAILSQLSPTARRGETVLPDPEPAALALAAAPGWDDVLQALHGVAVEDPFFAERGSRAAHGRPSPATRNLLTDLRTDVGHPAWPSMMLALVRHIGEGAPELAATVSGDEPRAALLALEAFGIPCALARFERFAGRYAAALLPGKNPPPLPWPPAGVARPEWRAAPSPGAPTPPCDWEPRHTGHLATTNLLVGEVPEMVEVRTLQADDPAWLAFLKAVERTAPRPAPGRRPSHGGSRPTTAILLRTTGSTSPTQGLLLRTQVDTSGARLHVDLSGPFEVTPSPEPDAAPYLAHAVASRVLADLRAWSRHVAPGATLRIVVSPEPVAGGDPFPQDVVDAIAETFAAGEGNEHDHGFDLVGSRGRRDGTPVRMPALHRTRCPEGHLPAWRKLSEGLGALRLDTGEPLVLEDDGEAMLVCDIDGNPLGGRVVPPLRAPASRAALAATLAEAALGPDALLLVGEGYLAVIAAEAWDRDDWSQDRAIALVLDGEEPSEGAWERMRAAFWRDNHDRYEALLIAQAERGEAPDRAHAPGTRTLQ